MRVIRGIGEIFVFLAIVAVLAPLVPTAGAIFDHHFAERMPDHGHIYYGHPDLRHKHAYEITHADVRSALPAPSPQVNGVVVLPSDLGTKIGPVAEMALTVMSADADSPISEPPLFPMTPPNDAWPPTAFLAPPETVPRTQS